MGAGLQFNTPRLLWPPGRVGLKGLWALELDPASRQDPRPGRRPRVRLAGPDPARRRSRDHGRRRSGPQSAIKAQALVALATAFQRAEAIELTETLG